MTIDCPSSSWKPDTYIYQDCWPPVPVDSIENCASECANSVYCRFYVFENRWDVSTWCSMYPTSYLMNSSTGGYYTTGECTRVEPAPQWQCNSDNVCLATIDGSDMLGAYFNSYISYELLIIYFISPFSCLCIGSRGRYCSCIYGEFCSRRPRSRVVIL